MRKNGFTLVELLITIAIIGVISTLSIFGLQGAREGARDTKRKSDLELIRSGIETYKSDCNFYPSGTSLPASLVGSGAVPSCPASNVYITQVPTDPLSPSRAYVYSSNGATYEICAALENGTGTVSCGGVSTCGTSTCNYKVTNP